MAKLFWKTWFDLANSLLAKPQTHCGPASGGRSPRPGEVRTRSAPQRGLAEHSRSWRKLNPKANEIIGRPASGASRPAARPAAKTAARPVEADCGLR